MKQIFLTILFALFAFSAVDAQTSEIISNLTPFPIPKKSKKKTDSGGIVIENHPLDFEIKIEYLGLFGDKKRIGVIVQTPNREIAFTENGEIAEAEINIYGRILSIDRVIGGSFEDKFPVRINKITLASLMNDSIIFRKVFELPKNLYKIDIVLRDLKSGERGIRSIAFKND